MKKLILLMMFVVLISFATAQLIYKHGDLIDLKVPCSFNGTFCTSSAVCNISVAYPNGTLLVENGQMTNTGNGMPNYTLPPTNILGEYAVHAACVQSALGDSTTFSILITSTGDSDRYSTPLFLLIGSIVFFLIGLYIENPIFTFVSGILFVISGVYMMIYGFAELTDLYTRTIAMVFIGVGIIVMVLSALDLIQEFYE